MTTAQLITLDLVVALLATAGWLGAGAAAGAGRPRVALGLLAAAVAATTGRVGTAVGLADRGWWFAQEKLAVAVPLAAATTLAALALAGPPLVRAVRAGDRSGSADRRRTVVPLLTSGYAAAAGLALTILVGYGGTWSDALVTVAATGAAAVITWWVMAPPPPAALPSGVRAGGAASVALAVVGVGLAFVPPPELDGGGGPAAQHPAPHGRSVSTLRGPDRPDGSGHLRRFTLTARKATVTLSSGRRVEAWTYNGRVPGPPVTASEGDLIEVTLRNADIERGVTLHWHGYDVPAGEDGAPGVSQEAVAPGEEFVYRFRATRAGTFWYHTHQVSDRGVRMGLYGPLVVTPRAEAAPAGLDLTLPLHTLDGAILLGEHDRRDVRAVPPGTPVRLRLINTDSGPHRFALAGTPYRLVAVDGSDLNGPGELTSVGLRLPAGGRYDLTFTMPAGPVALTVGDDGDGGLRLVNSPVAAPDAVEDTSGWPELDLTRYGTPAPAPFGPNTRFDRRFTLVLDRGLALAGGLPRYAYTVNGRAFPSTPTQLVRENDLVLMTVVNRGFETHPWHLHGHRVLVLTRNGRVPSGSPLWLDTFDARPGEVWQVAFRADNPGIWMNHCHNLGHADSGMALHLAYDGVSTPFHGAHGG
jgi:FtsP/CotA-like multicopper oxidase with cupredoxin domain